MSLISKSITLRVPSRIIYNAIKDTRLEDNFPEFFVGVKKIITNDYPYSQITFKTITYDNQIIIFETFKLKILGKNNTLIEYITKTNIGEKIDIVESIIQTHIANILYALLMLETGYVNGRIEKINREKSPSSTTFRNLR
jgi:hypothetical protein